jgi:hypothetical protein
MAVEVSATIDRAQLVRTFLYRAHLHASCADDYLHSDSPEYRELYPGFRDAMTRNHLHSARKFLELAEETENGTLVSAYYWIEDLPSASDTLAEIQAREIECLRM